MKNDRGNLSQLPSPDRDLLPLPVTHRAVVLPEYRDEMDHMNVMWYTFLFAEATRRTFIELGMTDEYFKTNNAGSFMLECHTRYVSEVRTGDRLEIRTRMLNRTSKRIHAMHFMTRLDDNRLAATLEIVCTHIDMATRRTSQFYDDVVKSMDAVLAAHSALGWQAPVCGAMDA